MKNEGKYIEITRKLFHYEYTEEELHRLLEQLETEKERKTFYKTVKHLWESVGKNEEQIPYDPEKLLQRILSSIRNKENQKRHKKSIDIRFTRKNFVRQFLKVAAVLIIAVLLFFGGRTIYHTHKKYACVYVKTPYGVRKSFVLPDSSRVWLNSGSELKYPKHFGKTRKICLEGEAYFEVTKDPKHPFIVHTRHINVKVLGTGFNVTAYKCENVEVTLVHGKVMAYVNKKGHVKKKVILSPGEQTVFSEKTKAFQVRKINTSIYTAWTQGRLVFNNAPLTDVAKKIDRWYNVKMVINKNDTVLSKFNYTVSFDKDSLSTVLQILHDMTPVCFKQSGKEILVTRDKKRWKEFININKN